MLKAGFAREIITPARGVPLAGYFQPRPNEGVADDICVKSVIFDYGKTIGGIVSIELCFISLELIDEIKELLEKEGISFADNLLFCVTHSHTAPYPCVSFGAKPDPEYLAFLRNQVVLSVKKAYDDLAETQIASSVISANPYAFNRRYFMRNGKVVTNPGKLNPGIVKPEGPVDREVGILELRRKNRPPIFIANIVNHTDTVSGSMVSADWPGALERELSDKLGENVPVITLIGASGDINHLNVSSAEGQAGLKEAQKIGKGYADIIFENLGKLQKTALSFAKVSGKYNILARNITDNERQNAQEIMALPIENDSGGSMTSEGLAEGNSFVSRFFASQLLEFDKIEAEKTRTFKLLAFSFGNDTAIVSVPGEPFTEIGLEIKKQSPFKTTFVVSHGMGYAGYIPMPGCFGRGGYETMPVVNGGCSPGTAQNIIETATEALAKLKKQFSTE